MRAIWPETPPQEMLDKATLPLEEELSTVSGLAVHLAGRLNEQIRAPGRRGREDYRNPEDLP